MSVMKRAPNLHTQTAHPEANLDGMLHVKDSSCCDSPQRTCRVCGARQHYQPVYGGYIEYCEQCDPWDPPGTHVFDDLDLVVGLAPRPGSSE